LEDVTSKTMPSPDGRSTLQAVVFDVDGTLYDGAALRRTMLAELLLHCAGDPRRLPILRTLQVYRREREHLADEEALDISRLQYERPAHRLGMSPGEVRRTVDPWIHERPLRHLARNRIPGTRRLFGRLRNRGQKIAILSDYPAASKLAALDLRADRTVCATDPGIDRLKPHPAGLVFLLDELGLSPGECLLIGDRDDRDGEVARRLGAPFLLRTNTPREDHHFRDFVDLAKRMFAD
jgi:FMN phosphatase YigB (HAD superfamily)